METVDSWYDPPVDKGRRACQYLVAMLTIETFLCGFATSFGVLLDFYQDDPRSPIKQDPHAKLILTLVGTINTGIMGITAPFISFWITKRPGIRRPLMFSGLLVCTLSLYSSAYSTSLSHLPEWFEQKRGFANGVVFTGTGLGGMVFPLMLDYLLEKYDAKFAIKVIVSGCSYFERRMFVETGTIFSQLAAGYLSDHYSPFLIGVSANVLGAASVLVIWGALSHNGIMWLFVFAAIYGCTAGAWTSLYFRVLKYFICW
ncbi:hypothetical protein PTTG_04404 [Puccinia triticina 1-1 BBBD Race 1]|uniref:Major facilitator superfamily (MFS) profile domain-containing protein n=1 Tax=Puccinia triticina (isolate 1-1 / race 1 (BBBD)) TaxID=630390 RepID=A0A180GMV2_PUCT1|nr:hypothetical protein PTTG_04404 [Puccinia triticina 1-1 BBBD Race 1]